MCVRLCVCHVPFAGLVDVHIILMLIIAIILLANYANVLFNCKIEVLALCLCILKVIVLPAVNF